jgi:hypothetical protein
MMLAYEMHRPRPEDQDQTTRHEVILKATDQADIMRLLALISIFHQGALDGAIDLMIEQLATEELPDAFQKSAQQHNDGQAAG